MTLRLDTREADRPFNALSLVSVTAGGVNAGAVAAGGVNAGAVAAGGVNAGAVAAGGVNAAPHVHSVTSPV